MEEGGRRGGGGGAHGCRHEQRENSHNHIRFRGEFYDGDCDDNGRCSFRLQLSKPFPSVADSSTTLTSVHTKIAHGLPGDPSDGPEQIRQTASSQRSLFSLSSPFVSPSLPPSLSFVSQICICCRSHVRYINSSTKHDRSISRPCVAMDAEVNNSSANPIRSQSQSLWSAVFATAANHYSPPFLLNGISQFVLRCLNC